MMKRSQFLKAAGSAFALPWVWSGAAHAQGGATPRGNCVLVPSEIAGPFPLDLNENDFFFRQDITEDRLGVRLRQRARILGGQNCESMANVRINVWHCDRDGGYSGHGTEEGLTYCRGYQFTDDNGECEFVTIAPGWCPGRVTYMHRPRRRHEWGGASRTLKCGSHDPWGLPPQPRHGPHLFAIDLASSCRGGVVHLEPSRPKGPSSILGAIRARGTSLDLGKEGRRMARRTLHGAGRIEHRRPSIHRYATVDGPTLIPQR